MVVIVVVQLPVCSPTVLLSVVGNKAPVSPAKPSLNHPLTTSANHPLTCQLTCCAAIRVGNKARVRPAKLWEPPPNLACYPPPSLNHPLTTSANHPLTSKLTCCAVISGWQQSSA